ncbi:MAG TPA: SRPBCC domain-containing protein [Terracidiphilus sp.]|jgi:uncharacterized protein YndB with AHSA1/START domain|nr:SRPBCC domain-containing protein [Terracidiphilus sp.]
MLATQTIEDLMLNLEKEIHVHASIETTFESLLEQMGPYNEGPDGSPIPMRLEPWPGGRWYRDLGNDNGHFWGHVQAIKRPTLIEIAGPLFASHPFVSNVQYRLSEHEGGTLIKFHHIAMGIIPEHLRAGVGGGWQHMLDRVRRSAEGK